MNSINTKDMSHDDLKSLANTMGLNTSGNRAQLAKRIRDTQPETAKEENQSSANKQQISPSRKDHNEGKPDEIISATPAKKQVRLTPKNKISVHGVPVEGTIVDEDNPLTLMTYHLNIEKV